MRAKAETASARERWRQTSDLLSRSRKTVPAHVDTARADLDAARSTLRDLEMGSRAEEVAQAEAELRGAEATLRRARIELARQKKLFDEGATASREVDNAEEALARAEASERARREALELLRRGAREQVIAAAKAKVRSAEASLRAAEGELAGLAAEARKVDESAAALRAIQAAEGEVRSARTRLQTLREERRAAQARIKQTRAAADQASAELTERAVFSSFDGIVGRRFVDPGDMASPSQALFTIVESGETWVSAEVDEQDLAPVYAGQSVVITAPAFVGREFVGKVARIGGEAVPQTEVRTGARIVRVRVSLAPTPPDQRRLLKPGMEVHSSGKATLAQSATLIPSDAVLRDGDGGFVWVIESSRARRRRIRTGYVNGPETEVVSGIRARESVVITGKENLRDGETVEAKKSAASP
jgi:HlyD family secretion protein